MLACIYSLLNSNLKLETGELLRVWTVPCTVLVAPTVAYVEAFAARESEAFSVEVVANFIYFLADCWQPPWKPHPVMTCSCSCCFSTYHCKSSAVTRADVEWGQGC